LSNFVELRRRAIGQVGNREVNERIVSSSTHAALWAQIASTVCLFLPTDKTAATGIRSAPSSGSLRFRFRNTAGLDVF